MGLPANIVLANGTLNDEVIIKKELLYKGMNGRWIERFYLSPTTSFIFKPLTNNGQLGKEVWIHEHILPLFPAIYPKIISYKISEQLDLNWMIIEDLGALSHNFNEESVLGVIKWVAWWHSLPIEKFEAVPDAGLKPQIEMITADVQKGRNDFFRQLLDLQLAGGMIEHVYTLLEHHKFSKRLVLSHGDLHLGNFAIVNQQLKVLDWEHTHLNAPYWDLYHVIDMSHPIFPKVVTSEFRQRILESYIVQAGVADVESFLKEYYLFSAVFSIWMISLIQKDIEANDGKWPIEQLHNQLQETILSLRQCASALMCYK